MTRPDWDDERLAAAFRARFERAAPPDLAGAVHNAISVASPTRAGWFRPNLAWAMAAAAVVLVVVGGAAVGLGGLGRPGGVPPAPSASATVPTPGIEATPDPRATPTEQALPGSVLGLPIIHVTDAIAIRDGGVDDRELAVMGWFTPAPPLTCTPAPLNPLQRQCPDRLVWLTEDAESLIHVNGGALTASDPVGPALNPFLDGLDPSWITPVTDSNADSVPTDVVFVGHFDDRRAALCPGGEQAACRGRFVVDSVAFVKGRPVPPSLVRLTGTPATSSVADIEAVIANEAPQSPILSTTVVDGPVGLAQMEPSLGNGQAGLIQRPVLVVVRVLESDRISTYIVIDGTDAIYEMNPAGEAISVGGSPTPSGATASAAPWPPAGATVVTLTSQVGAGTPPAEVAVVDHSGRLVGVTEKGDVDPSTMLVAVPIGAYPEPGKPGRVHIVWTGGICDSRITVTVAADLKIITFEMGPQPLCDTMGIDRELVLDFSGSVDVSAIEFVRKPG